MQKHLAIYPMLRHWPSQGGRKPSKQAIRMAHKVARPGSKDAMAVAMALRPEGTTQGQVIQVLGHPHRNKIRSLLTHRKAKLLKMPDKDGMQVYKIDLK